MDGLSKEPEELPEEMQNCAPPEALMKGLEILDEISKSGQWTSENLRKYPIIALPLPCDVGERIVRQVRLSRINECYETFGTISDADEIVVPDSKKKWVIKKAHKELLIKIGKIFEKPGSSFLPEILVADESLRFKRAKGFLWCLFLDSRSGVGYAFNISYQSDQTETKQEVPVKLLLRPQRDQKLHIIPNRKKQEDCDANCFITESKTIAGKELVFSRSMEKNQIVFTEAPLVIDAVIEISQTDHMQRHNDRPAWSIVEQCLKTLSREQIELLLLAKFAANIVHWTKSWEAGDDAALHYMTQQSIFCSRKIRALYDIIATCNIVARVKKVPFSEGEMLVSARHGFFVLLSRANHSCIPSVALHPPMEHEQGPMKVVTLHDVVKDAPLTFDYLSLVSLEQKRPALLQCFGFRCECPRCVTLCHLLECNRVGKLRCPCHCAHYCSKDHQREDWQRHKINHNLACH